jgi:hypothetical protein
MNKTNGRPRETQVLTNTYTLDSVQYIPDKFTGNYPNKETDKRTKRRQKRKPATQEANRQIGKATKHKH